MLHSEKTVGSGAVMTGPAGPIQREIPGQVISLNVSSKTRPWHTGHFSLLRRRLATEVGPSVGRLTWVASTTDLVSADVDGFSDSESTSCS
jgi:hypothetical protein